MKQRIFNLIILDESGSMERIKRATIDSVNETLETIRSAERNFPEQEHLLSLVTFNDAGIKFKADCDPIEKVKRLRGRDFNPDCCTPLYDAMGRALNSLSGKVTKDDRVLVTILTDGLENSSREYNQADIRALVSDLRERGWIFTYMGANQDVAVVARGLSIGNAMAYEATAEDVTEKMACCNQKRMHLFERINEADFSPEKENETFFD